LQEDIELDLLYTGRPKRFCIESGAGVALGERTLGIQENETLKLHVADALKFAKNAPAGAYDIIIEDVFTYLTKPDFAMQPEYIYHLARLLASQGKLFVNSLAKDEAEISRWKSLLGSLLHLNTAHRIAGSNLLWEAVKA
jgi:spermidine synthase